MDVRLQQTGQCRAGSVLTPRPAARHLPAETAARSTITQIYEGTNQIQRVVMARQLLK
jgi:alkylation response protein AidB-like acyl-CoA dehydrogenase